MSVLYLALGDPFASTLGIKFGKLGPRFPNGKSLIGSLGGFVVCMATTALYFAPSLRLCGSLALVSLLGGVAGSLPSLFPILLFLPRSYSLSAASASGSMLALRSAA